MSNQNNNNSCTCGCCADCRAKSSVQLYNSQGLSALRYRLGTHGSFKREMLEALSAYSALSKLTTRYDNDLAIATLDAWATVLDVLSFYQERICNEGYLRTAIERLSVVHLAQHISYKPRPGLAAATYLAFSMNEALGAPSKAIVPVGTKVQSIPKQKQLPQVFETIEEIEARVEWNGIKPQTRVKQIPQMGDMEIYLEGIITGLQPGDGMLMIRSETEENSTNENRDFRKISKIVIDPNASFTKVTWDKALGDEETGVKPAAKENFKVYALRQRASLFGYNAPDFQTMSGNIKSGLLSKGLLGFYYTGVSFDSFVQLRTDNTINFGWETNPPPSSATITNFSVRWNGLILAPTTGVISFRTFSDDGVRLWVNNQLLVNNWSTHGGTSDVGVISLQSGQFYDLLLEYFQGGGPATIILFWSWPGIDEQIIPADSFFHSAESLNEWPGYTISDISKAAQTIYLDAIYPKIIKGSWLIMTMTEYTEIYEIKDAVESSRTGFTLTSKTMKLELDGENLDKFDAHIRDTTIYAQSEELEIAEKPVTNTLSDNPITLERLIPSLVEGQKVIVSGKRMRLQIPKSVTNIQFTPKDNSTQIRTLVPETSLIILKQHEEQPDGSTLWTVEDDGGIQGTIQVNGDILPEISSWKDDDIVSEFHIIDSIDLKADPTVISLKESITNYFDIQTVTINANVAEATHGETKQETLGSGDGSQVFQKFQLKQKPLTFISAGNASGAKTTLEIRVNDIQWNEVPTLYGASAKDKVYTTIIDDDGTVTVCFGDGITGSRVPTGTANVKATYRAGIGLNGLLDAGQLSMLVTPQLGVNKVNNPIDTSGAQEPEIIDDARKNAPLTVLTLDRIVSARDFENFTRAFAGISKAKADIVWNGEQEIVFITVASADGTVVDEFSILYLKLLDALKGFGHTNSEIKIANYKQSFFTVDAAISVDSNYLFDDVKQKVIDALSDAFSFDAMDFGQDVTPAQVITVIQQVEGIIYVDLNELKKSQDAFIFSNSKFPLFKNVRLTATLPIINKNNTLESAELLLIDINNSSINNI